MSERSVSKANRQGGGSFCFGRAVFGRGVPHDHRTYRLAAGMYIGTLAAGSELKLGTVLDGMAWYE